MRGRGSLDRYVRIHRSFKNYPIRFLQSIVKHPESQVAWSILRRVLSRIIKGYPYHINEAFQVPCVKSNRPLPLVSLDSGIQAKGLSHQPGMPLQFGQFVSRYKDGGFNVS